MAQWDMDEKAKATGWLILRSGEAYSRQITFATEIFLLKMFDGTWSVWYGNWSKNESKPYSEKTLVSGLSFEKALQRANNYIQWRTGNKRVR